jgi:hypothetical protein
MYRAKAGRRIPSSEIPPDLSAATAVMLREASDAVDLDFVDHVFDARHVTDDPEDLVEDIDRLDSAAQDHGRAATHRNAQMVAGDDIRRA